LKDIAPSIKALKEMLKSEGMPRGVKFGTDDADLFLVKYTAVFNAAIKFLADKTKKEVLDAHVLIEKYTPIIQACASELPQEGDAVCGWMLKDGRRTALVCG
jgi:hypothetical protein